MGRVVGNLTIIAALAVLVAVGAFFYGEFAEIRDREARVKELQRVAKDEGPCSAFVQASTMLRAGRREGWLGYDTERDLQAQHRTMAKRIVADDAGRAALVKGSNDGLVSKVLCEQIEVSEQVGEPHPVMALLRFMREQNPCEEELALDRVLAGLRSHRSILMHGLLQDVSRLRCLSPAMAEEVARHGAQLLREEPQVFDDLDVGRVAAFITAWAPLAAAQAGCAIDAVDSISHVGHVIGCSPDHRQRVLPRYQLLGAVPSRAGKPDLPVGTEVLLLDRRLERCEVRPLQGQRRIDEVRCADLKLVSDLDIAILIEPVRYGRAEADLISGLATFSGRSGIIRGTRGYEPKHRSWFVYNRGGEALGSTYVVGLDELARQAGVKLPSAPLREFCRAAGAKYCYDVDWTQIVSKVAGHRSVFLSRPMNVFLREAHLSEAAAVSQFQQAFGRPLNEGAMARAFDLKDGARLWVEQRPDGIELRWRLLADAAWRGQGFGQLEGGEVPPSARLLAAMDLQGDGLPELILQRSTRGMRTGKVVDLTDEVHMLHFDESHDGFVTLTQLTVHEY